MLLVPWQSFRPGCPTHRCKACSGCAARQAVFATATSLTCRYHRQPLEEEKSGETQSTASRYYSGTLRAPMAYSPILLYSGKQTDGIRKPELGPPVSALAALVKPRGTQDESGSSLRLVA